MSDQVTFSQAVAEHLQTLQQYVPVVDRVHGGSHPEFHTVKSTFDTIAEKIKSAGASKPHLDDEFAKLSETTLTTPFPMMCARPSRLSTGCLRNLIKPTMPDH